MHIIGRDTLSAAALLFALGCGGGDDGSASADETAGGEDHHHHHGHHGHGEAPHAHRMSAAQERFHDLFAPLWHAEADAERAARACAAAAQITELGQAAAREVTDGRTEPAADDAARAEWDADLAIATDMDQATAAFAAEACAADASAEAFADAARRELADRQLSTIHDVFHRAMERWQATHPE